MDKWVMSDEHLRAFAGRMAYYYQNIEKEHDRTDPEWQRCKQAVEQFHEATRPPQIDKTGIDELIAVLEAEIGSHGTGWFEMLVWCKAWRSAKMIQP